MTPNITDIMSRDKKQRAKNITYKNKIKVKQKHKWDVNRNRNSSRRYTCMRSH